MRGPRQSREDALDCERLSPHCQWRAAIFLPFWRCLGRGLHVSSTHLSGGGVPAQLVRTAGATVKRGQLTVATMLQLEYDVDARIS